MLISRTPLRISLGGGGTDLPSFYGRYGGFVLSAAIDKHVYIAINRTFTDDYFLKYSQLERVSAPDEIRHPIMRAALELHPVGPSVEIASLADIPAGTGLGSSGAFTVGLLRALYAYKREHITPGDLAEEAALSISTTTLHDLEEHLLMFFTGYSRDASALLTDQRRRTETEDDAMVAALKNVQEVGLRIRDALEAGETRDFASLMHEHWLNKRDRSTGMSNEAMNRWYDVAMANGALGGKLVGAGGGGFLLFYADDPKALRQAMIAEGLPEVRFSFEFEGSSMLVRD
jgi:D-glycero-alpha-D-manno-heptose-7-phosphate kinase